MADSELEMLIHRCPAGVREKTRTGHYPPGEFVLRQGDEVSRVCILLKGSTKHFVITPNGVYYLIYISSPGDLLGELEVFQHFPVKHNIQALTDCETLEIDGEDFIRWLERDKDFTLFCFRHITSKVYQSNAMSPINVAYPLKYRVESFLWSAAVAGKRYIAKEDILMGLGAKLRSVNRILQGLIEDSLIEYDSKVIKVLALDRLEEDMRRQEDADTE